MTRYLPTEPNHYFNSNHWQYLNLFYSVSIIINDIFGNTTMYKMNQSVSSSTVGLTPDT